MILGSFLDRIFDWHGWVWGGWSIFVALGTIGLAVVTVTLVGATRVLARNSAAAIKAEWRPVVIVRERSPADDTAPIVIGEKTLTVMIENVGRGPALGLTCELLNCFDNPNDRFGRPVGAPEEGFPMPAALAPGEWTRLDGT